MNKITICIVCRHINKLFSLLGQVGIRDLIKFDITDGHNPLIDRYFYISIAYMDILFPRVINKGVTIKEGGQVKLTTGKITSKVCSQVKDSF